jgi:hypothetical protein
MFDVAFLGTSACVPSAERGHPGLLVEAGLRLSIRPVARPMALGLVVVRMQNSVLGTGGYAPLSPKNQVAVVTTGVI